MVTFFSTDELLDIAVGIEKNGQIFYKSMAERASNEATRSMYRFLAEAEKHHESVFEKMRNDGLRITVPESYAGEYAEYLNSLVNSLVFKNPRDAKQQSRGSSEIEALTTGIQAEKDSIIFYSEVLSMAKDSDKANLEAIIREEKSHLQQLAGLKSYLETPRGG